MLLTTKAHKGFEDVYREREDYGAVSFRGYLRQRLQVAELQRSWIFTNNGPGLSQPL